MQASALAGNPTAPASSSEPCATLARFDETVKRALDDGERDRPFVTLTFAQSLDGSITGARGQATRLSGEGTMAVTHGLRARHDAILVGINTVIVDDPRLTVRLADGPDPQPVVLDSRLRFPLGGRLLTQPERRPIIATTAGASGTRAERLRGAGAEVWALPTSAGGLVDLDALMSTLHDAGVRSVMVEGGARVITSFLRARLADYLIMTIAPVLLAGIPTLCPGRRFGTAPLPALLAPAYEAMNGDLLLAADLHSAAAPE